MTKTMLIRGLALGVLAIALSGCYYGPPPPAYPAYYGYDGGYYSYPAYYGGGYYYGPSVSFGYFGGWHDHDWDHEWHGGWHH
jgi:hypothetical protein